MKRHLAITATFVLLLIGARTAWGDSGGPGLDAARSGWSAGLVGGASTDIGISSNTRAVVGATAARLFGEHLRLDLALKLAPRSLGLDGETLQRVKSWHRVSPPDFCGARAGHPRAGRPPAAGLGSGY